MKRIVLFALCSVLFCLYAHSDTFKKEFKFDVIWIDENKDGDVQENEVKKTPGIAKMLHFDLKDGSLHSVIIRYSKNELRAILSDVGVSITSFNNTKTYYVLKCDNVVYSISTRENKTYLIIKEKDLFFTVD